MEKKKLLIDIDDMITLINENEYLFHDGIDLDIVYLLQKIKNYIKKEK